MRIGAPRDFAAGLLFVIVGLGAAYVARNYTLGTAQRMGPGYFPTYAGLLLAFLGAVIAFRGVHGRGEAIGGFPIKAIVVVLASVVAFGLLIKPAGLAIASTTLVLIGTAGSTRSRVVPAIVLAVVLTAFSAAVFTYGLGLPLPVFGSWFER